MNILPFITLQGRHRRLIRNIIRRRGKKKPTGLHAQRTATFQLCPKIMALFTFRTNKLGSLLTCEHYFHWHYFKNVHVTNIDWFKNRGNIRVRQHWDVVQQLLLYKSNKYYIFLVCVCILSYPECTAHASCCHV